MRTPLVMTACVGMLAGSYLGCSTCSPQPSVDQVKPAVERVAQQVGPKSTKPVYLYTRDEEGLRLEGCYLPGKRCQEERDDGTSVAIPCEWVKARDESDCPQRPTKPPEDVGKVVMVSENRVIPAPKCTPPEQVDFDLTLAETNLILVRAIHTITGQWATLRRVAHESAFGLDLDGDGLRDTLYAVNVKFWIDPETNEHARAYADRGPLLRDLRTPGRYLTDLFSGGWWLLRRGSDPTRVFVVREAELPFLEALPKCTDFDLDGQVEFYVREGGETDHVSCIVEFSGARLETRQCD